MLAWLVLLALSDPSRGFGFDACVIGDVDRDGTRDVLLPGYVDREWTPTGASILSGTDGTTLRSIDLGGFGAWIVKAVGDLDGDDCEDFAFVSRVGKGCVLTAVSSARGLALWTRPLDSSDDVFFGVHAAADDDCDGTRDVWIGVGRHADRKGLVRVTLLSGVDGNLIREQWLERGADIEPIGDVDGDGRTDAARIVLDCHNKDLHVQVLESKHAFRPREIGIVNVACTWDMRVHDVGDLDGDGLHDVGVSALEHGVQVFSSRGTGLLLEHEMEFEHPPMTGYGSDLRGIVDAAGRAFVLVGVEYADVYSGEVEVWSVAERRLVMRIRAPDKREVHFGARIEPMNDIDRDGTPDFLCIPNHTYGSEPNSIYAMSTRAGASPWFAAGRGSSYAVVHGRPALGFHADPRAGSHVGRDGSFGMRSCVMGDLDGDGQREILVVTCARRTGDRLALVLSGADGLALGELDLCAGLPVPDVLGLGVAEVAALGDLDRDGIDDFGVDLRRKRPGRERWIAAFSTCTGRALWTVAIEPDAPRFESGLESACDENGDGTVDVLVPGAVIGGQDGTRLATIVSGVDGRSLRMIAVGPQDFVDEACFTAIGDADGDGLTDVACAAAVSKQIEISWRSSRTGDRRELGTLPYDERDTFGVQCLPDLDLDGARDVAVRLQLAGFRVVSVRSGRTLAEHLEPVEMGWTSRCAALSAFIDRDGRAALLTGGFVESLIAGSVTRRGLGASEPLFECGAGWEEWHFGERLLMFDDHDRDGTPDFVAVSEHSGGDRPGALYVCSGRDGRTLWVARALAQ